MYGQIKQLLVIDTVLVKKIINCDVIFFSLTECMQK